MEISEYVLSHLIKKYRHYSVSITRAAADLPGHLLVDRDTGAVLPGHVLTDILRHLVAVLLGDIVAVLLGG